MEVLIIVNVLVIIYTFVTMKVAFKRKDKMTDTAYHHLISHMLLVTFLMVAIDIYIFKGYISPLVFVGLHLLQHVTKENLRLLDTNRWTPTIHDEHSSFN